MKKIEYIEFVNTKGEKVTLEVAEIKDIFIKKGFGLGQTDTTVILMNNNEKYYTDEKEFEVKTKIKADRIERESMLIW
jgi:hypothetical protein